MSYFQKSLFGGEISMAVTGNKINGNLSTNLPNGIANKLNNGDLASHDWYRFVLSFPPHLVREYINKFEIGKGDVVLDPFCGTGTTLVECKKLGIQSIGVEAHPMAYYAAITKTNWSISPIDLLEHSKKIAEIANNKLLADGISDIPSNKKVDLNGNMRVLPDDSNRILIKNSISPLPLHKVLVLMECINNNKESELFPFENISLAKVLVSTISNLHFGPEVGVGKIKKDSAVIGPWLDQVQKIALDIENLQSYSSTPTKVYHGDSRSILETFQNKSIDFVFTSPPYPNEKDYTRTTRLESVVLGLINNRDELRSLKQTMIRSNTRGIYKSDQDDKFIQKFPKIVRIANRIENKRIRLGKTSGFEKMYSKVTLQYFGGMYKHLASLRPILTPGALLGYVVGDQASYLQVMIRTGQLLGDIAESLGYELIDIDLFRTRLATATKKQLREEVVILRWPG
jgi:DNA modification methylase